MGMFRATPVCRSEFDVTPCPVKGIGRAHKRGHVSHPFLARFPVCVPLIIEPGHAPERSGHVQTVTAILGPNAVANGC